MATPGVGQDIEAVCGKCGPVWHVVMAKMGDRIAKVVCKRCGGHHRYRREDGEPQSSTASAGEARRTAGGTATRARAVVVEPKPLPAFDPAKPPRRYAPAESYQPGDRVEHPSFGVGVVAGSPGAGKVEVVFPAGARVLACAKGSSTLSRPALTLNAPISDRPPK